MSKGEVKISKAFEKEVTVDLTDEQIEEYKQQHLKACNDLEKAQGEKSEAMREHNAALKDLRAAERDLRSAINSGSTKITVKVKEHANLRTGNVEVKRVDTGEVVAERAMTGEERQVEAFDLEPDSDGSSATVAEMSEARNKKKTSSRKGKGKSEQPEA